jgi:hypothetical protein
MENESFLRKISRWRKDHREIAKQVKYVLKLLKHDNHESSDQVKFPPAYNEVHQAECKLDESKPPKWMDVEINFKEVDISNDG